VDRHFNFTAERSTLSINPTARSRGAVSLTSRPRADANSPRRNSRVGKRDITELKPSFSELGLSQTVLKALAAENHLTPTPIQLKAIPVALEGRDIFGIAQTGTGKTAAFALPIIERLLAEGRRPERKGCRALVLAPTRELATQIAKSFQSYSRFAKLSVTTVFGGVAANPQIRALSGGVDVLVATPGRLLDHIGAGHCQLSNTSILVLDEADQMLDLGFYKPIRSIASRISRQRQSLFFSATLPAEIEALSKELLRDPVSVRVTPIASTAERVEQKVIHVDRARKARLLAELLGGPDMARTLVFTRTKRGADKVAKYLVESGVKANAIHGNKSQNQRERALDAFRASKIQVLVATDIAARGIDIPDVSHVVNYELPEVPESYVHRIGRTARAGREGWAVSFCDPSERKLLRDIERLTKQTIPFEQSSGGTDGEGLILENARSIRPRTGRGRNTSDGGPGNRSKPTKSRHRGKNRTPSPSQAANASAEIRRGGESGRKDAGALATQKPDSRKSASGQGKWNKTSSKKQGSGAKRKGASGKVEGGRSGRDQGAIQENRPRHRRAKAKRQPEMA